MKRTKVGHAVGRMGTVTHWDPALNLGPCGHKGCTRPAVESEQFWIKTPKGSRYQTKRTYFLRCARHEHSHWKEIGYGPQSAPADFSGLPLGHGGRRRV